MEYGKKGGRVFTLNTVAEHYNPNVYLCAAHFMENSLFSVAFVSSRLCKTVYRSLAANHNTLGQPTNHSTF